MQRSVPNITAHPDGVYAIDTGYVRPRCDAVHLIVREGRAAVAHLGDCRIHQIRNGRFLRVTHDHVLHQERRIVLRGIGMGSNPEGGFLGHEAT